jgi:DNA-binding beta-propeller fold protein YncE
MSLSTKIVLIVLLAFIITSCERNEGRKDNKARESESIRSYSNNVPLIEQNQGKILKLTYLEKKAVIEGQLSEREDDFFAKITDICISGNDELFVADSLNHRIFKFNKDHMFVKSFGRSGQGPGEFSGELNITAGNDGKIYITDNGSHKILAFSPNGDYLNQYPLNHNFRDKVLVNSKGEIFLLSPNGYNILDVFDSRMKYIVSLIDISYQIDVKYGIVPKRYLLHLTQRPDSSSILKIMARDDDLFIIMNSSQIIINIDSEKRMVNKYRINNSNFVDDFKSRLNKLNKENEWINCFGSAFIDDKKEIYICYYNDNLGLPEIYRYDKGGRFLDTIRVLDERTRTNRIISACDRNGSYYRIDYENSRILIYRIEEKS